LRLQEAAMKVSAQNLLKGVVRSVERGAVNALVILDLPGGTPIVSVITLHAVDALKLAPGREAYAIIKASNVMIGVD
jgi:molybdopterin-binding protein